MPIISPAEQDRLRTQVRAANRLVACLRNILRGSKYQGRGAMRQRIDSILRTYDNALSSPAKAEQSSTPEHDKLWEEYQAYVAAQEPGEVHYSFSGWLANVKPELPRNGYGPRQQQVLDGPVFEGPHWLPVSKPGSTVHSPGCICGFCKAGFTKDGTSLVSDKLRGYAMWHIDDGRPIDAIKLIRRAAGCSLLDAKKYVDSLRCPVAE